MEERTSCGCFVLRIFTRQNLKGYLENDKKLIFKMYFIGQIYYLIFQSGSNQIYWSFYKYFCNLNDNFEDLIFTCLPML